MDREKRLNDILAAEAVGSQGGRAADGDKGTPIRVDEEKEGAETPVLYPDLS